MADDKKIKILIISFDWRNIFENDPELMKSKLNRDHLRAEFNDFFIFSWSNKKYHKKVGNFETVHLLARFRHLRFVYDFLSIFILPISLLHYKFVPDLIICYDFPFVISCILPKYFWKSRVAIILSALPSQLVRTRKSWGNIKFFYQILIEKISVKFIDDFFCIGEATKKYLLDLNVKKDITIVFPDVFSEHKADIENAESGRAKEKYGIPSEKSIILSVGRLEPEKNYEKLLVAWSKINNNNLVLLIVGDGILDSKLKKMCDELEIADKVVFAGRVSHQEIWNYYKDAAAFLLFSKSEGLGLVFWEAMMMKVPVIGSRTGGIADSLGENQERGFFWEDLDDKDSLEKIINKCVFRDKEVEDKIRAAKEYVDYIASLNYTINKSFNNKL